MNLSENLKRIRKEHNLSQEQLAESLGVSRQAVSKWESNGAYPEMEKVLQICQMFNINIDDFLNKNINDLNSGEQEKNTSKFIDDFLAYITKTIDMFSSMKLKEKLKCIFEEILLIIVMILVFLIIGSILGNVVQNMLSFLPWRIYEIIYNILKGIYLTFSLILGIISLLYIFKVRYLDYYQMIKEEPVESEKSTNIINDNNEEENSEIKKIVLEKKQEKIIIRDPKHSEYKFIQSILKVLLFILKIVALLISLIFCLTLVVLNLLLVLSILFIKSGFLFVGGFLTIIATIMINIITLIILYNFIVSRKTQKNKLAISFILSLIIIGIGIGLIFLGLKDFTLVMDTQSDSFVETEITMPMENSIFFEDWHSNIEYIESDNKDIKLVYRHSTYYEIKMAKEGDYYYFYQYPTYQDSMDIARAYINDINNKEIINYSNYKIYIYTNRENLDNLVENRNAYFKNESTLNALYEELEIKENKIYELEEELREKNEQIDNLENIEKYE